MQGRPSVLSPMVEKRTKKRAENAPEDTTENTTKNTSKKEEQEALITGAGHGLHEGELDRPFWADKPEAGVWLDAEQQRLVRQAGLEGGLRERDG